jgi:DNA polymerase phi
MELYTELASNEHERRKNAAKELVGKIISARNLEKSEKGTDIPYALNRLIKGLASGRESARLGFSIALTEVVSVSSLADLASCRIGGR